MAFFPSFGFKPTPAPVAPATLATPAAPDTGTATLPNNANNPTTPADPLAPFAKMYDVSETAETAPQFNLDAAALSTASKGMDFMRGLDPAVLQRAQTGDSTAIMEMMAHGNRQAYELAMSHSATLSNKFTDAREAFNNKGFAGKVKGELTMNALTNSPNFSHPVVRKELIRVSREIQQQNPDASPQEVADQAKQYLTEISGALNPAQHKPSAKDKGDTNWDSFFDGPQDN